MTHLSPKQAFADAVVECGLVPWLLTTLEFQLDPNEGNGNVNQQYRRWSILESLASSPSLASELVLSSGWLELLSVIAGYKRFNKVWASREGSAKTLARLLYDPQVSTMTGENLLLLVLALVLHFSI